MVGSGYWKTVQVFHDALQAAVARVTPAIILRQGPFPPGEPSGRLYLSQTRAPLGGAGGHALSIALRFRVEPATEGDDRWEAQTFACSYLLFRDDREIVAYHWDHEPMSPGAVRTPHVHFGKDLPHAGLPVEDRERMTSLAAAHMPTGVIPFTQILRAAIRDLGVEPLRQQGERLEDARASAERSFAEAESALWTSFAWWRGHEVGSQQG